MTWKSIFLFIVAMPFTLTLISQPLSKKPDSLIITGDKNFRPFHFINKEGRCQGLVVSIWNLWSQKTNIKIIFNCNLNWDDATSKVKNGQADIVGAIMKNDERLKWLDFGPMLIKTEYSIFKSKSIYGFSDLNSYEGQIAVIKDDYPETYIPLKYPNTKSQIQAFNNHEELFDSLLLNKVSLFIMEPEVAEYYFTIKKIDPNKFEKITTPLLDEILYAGVTNRSPETLDWVNYGFSLIKHSEIDSIYKKWNINYKDEEQIWDKFLIFRENYPNWYSFALIVLVYLIITIILFILSFIIPVELIKIANFIDANFSLEGNLLGLKLTLSLNLIIPLRLIAYGNRTINKWVIIYHKQFVDFFDSSENVQKRSLFLPSPIKINSIYYENDIEIEINKIIKYNLVKQKILINICGEPGIGKTTIGISILHRLTLLNERYQSEFLKYPALPLFIEKDIDVDDNFDVIAYITVVLNKLSDFSYSAPFTYLLLKRKRIILFIDGHSEMPKLNKNNAALYKIISNVNFLVLSSRRNQLPDIDDVFIEPQSLKNIYITDFVKKYLKSKNIILEDQELFKLCYNLSGVHDNKEITPLFARLYLDIFIKKKFSPTEIDSKAKLVVEYIRISNDKIASSEKLVAEIILPICKYLSWLEINNEFQPLYFDVDSIDLVVKDKTTDDILNYLRFKLAIIIKLDIDSSIYKFTNDSIAEYLCGYYIVEEYNKNNNEPFNKLKSFLLQEKILNKDFLISFSEVCRVTLEQTHTLNLFCKEHIRLIIG